MSTQENTEWVSTGSGDGLALEYARTYRGYAVLVRRGRHADETVWTYVQAFVDGVRWSARPADADGRPLYTLEHAQRCCEALVDRLDEPKAESMDDVLEKLDVAVVMPQTRPARLA